mmetsp:Transcript_15970/g.13948  ORF Transcript_15970/g.13948 Transcript_15970/m.13948 type:complete len:175 (-) Transcript_15970:25-549(-)
MQKNHERHISTAYKNIRSVRNQRNKRKNSEHKILAASLALDKNNINFAKLREVRKVNLNKSNESIIEKKANIIPPEELKRKKKHKTHSNYHQPKNIATLRNKNLFENMIKYSKDTDKKIQQMNTKLENINYKKFHNRRRLASDGMNNVKGKDQKQTILGTFRRNEKSHRVTFDI